MDIKKIIETDFKEKIEKMVDGQEVNFETKPKYFKVEPISETMIVDVINKYDRTFEYLDCNGVDRDWSHEFSKNGMLITIWGSATDGVCVMQSKKEK